MYNSVKCACENNTLVHYFSFSGVNLFWGRILVNITIIVSLHLIWVGLFSHKENPSSETALITIESRQRVWIKW